MIEQLFLESARRADFSGEIIQIPNSDVGYLRQQKENPAFLEGKSWQDHEPTPDNPAPIQSIPHDTGIVSCGENLWKNTLADTTIQGISFSFSAGKYTVTGSTADYPYIKVAEIPQQWGGKTIYIKRFNYETTHSTTLRVIDRIGILGQITAVPEGRVLTLPLLKNNLFVEIAISPTTNLTMSFYGSITLGDTAPPDYTPYRGSTTHLSLIGAPNAPMEWAGQPISLMSLPDGTVDEYRADEGVVIKWIKQIVLNGTEIWSVDGAAIQFYIPLSDVSIASVKPLPLSNKFKYREIVTLENGEFRWGQRNTPSNKNIIFKIDGIETVADWKTWVSNNNVVLQYPLATPYEIPVTSVYNPEIPVIAQPKIITVEDTIGTVYNLDGAKMNINAISYGGE